MKGGMKGVTTGLVAGVLLGLSVAHAEELEVEARSSVVVLVAVTAVEDLKTLRQDVAAALERGGGRSCEIRLALRSVPDRSDVLEAFGWCAP